MAESKSTQVRVLFDQSGRIEVQTSPTPPVSLHGLFPSEMTDPQLVETSSKTGRTLCLGIDDCSSATNLPTGAGGPWTVIPDTNPTKASPFTCFKTTQRDIYLAARDRVGITSHQDSQEVILINSEGHVVEGSFTNIYLSRKGRWITPPIASGCLPGTVRRWLLERGLCHEEDIPASSLVDQENCYLSNGVRGLFRGCMSCRETLKASDLVDSSSWR